MRARHLTFDRMSARYQSVLKPLPPPSLLGTWNVRSNREGDVRHPLARCPRRINISRHLRHGLPAPSAPLWSHQPVPQHRWAPEVHETHTRQSQRLGCAAGSDDSGSTVERLVRSLGDSIPRGGLLKKKWSPNVTWTTGVSGSAMCASL